MIGLARRMRRAFWCSLVVGVVVFGAGPVLAYLHFGVDLSNGQQVKLKWAINPVQYFVSNRGASGVSPLQFAGAVARAFSTWEAVPTASIEYRFTGFTDALAGDDDGQTTLGFLPMPDLDRVLAATSYVIDDATGELLESDIFFNSTFSWSTAPSGEPGRFDVESIALHEIGHLSGLGHSALGETTLSGNGRRVIAAEAVMFPIAFGPGNIAGRTLRADDIAGISDLYPDGGFRGRTGSIVGRVTTNGRGTTGAHVVAFDLARRTLVANFTVNGQGNFTIAGLQPGPHVLRIEPLDDADTDSFFDPSFGADLDFLPTFFNRIVVVPTGGSGDSVEIAVRPK
jgi:hypothetical protein